MEEQAARHGPRSHVGKPGRVDHGDVGIFRPAAFGDVPSGQRAGQTYVGENQVGGVLAAEVQRLFTAFRLEDVEALTRQDIDHRLADELIVLDHQNSQRHLQISLSDRKLTGQAPEGFPTTAPPHHVDNIPPMWHLLRTSAQSRLLK